MTTYFKSLRSPDDQQLQARNEPSRSTTDSSPSDLIGIDPLPQLQRKGLIMVLCFASVSLLAIVSLLVFLTYRFIFWRKYYRRYVGYNQYVILVYNLALADLQQCLGFVVSLRWILIDSLHESDAFCFLQGVWLHIANPMSGMFVLAIAVFTFLHIMLGYQLGYRSFVATVVGLWIFGVVLVVIPIVSVGRFVWSPVFAWCWISPEHSALRLWTHYFWIFAAQFFTILLYTIMFVQLRRQIVECVTLGGRNTNSLRRLNRVLGYMVLYPAVYITLTLPIAIGRTASVRGHPPSVTYFCISGSLMALSGLCDTLLYTLTRKNSVLDPQCKQKPGHAPNVSTTSSMWSLTIPSASSPPHRSGATDESTPNSDIDCRA